MSTVDRIAAIMDILNTKKRVLVSELTKEFSVSGETVRRDLSKLVKAGKASRIYGGVELVEQTDAAANVVAAAQPEKKEPVDKSILNKLAASLIKDGMTVMIAGSDLTTRLLDEVKSNTQITVVTNSIGLLTKYASRSDFELISTGGELDPKSLCLYGDDADSTIKHYNADLSFVTCDRLGLDYGVMHNELKTSDMAIKIASQSNQRVLVASHDQFQPFAKVNTFEFEDISILITDRPLNQEWMDVLTEAGIKVLCPKEDATDEKAAKGKAKNAASTNEAVDSSRSAPKSNADSNPATAADAASEAMAVIQDEPDPEALDSSNLQGPDSDSAPQAADEQATSDTSPQVADETGTEETADSEDLAVADSGTIEDPSSLEEESVEAEDALDDEPLEQDAGLEDDSDTPVETSEDEVYEESVEEYVDDTTVSSITSASMNVEAGEKITTSNATTVIVSR